ncbi:polysaccharide deacetylase family protein [Oricola indica]|uniref:polysaccharide deacetylase family protein n=1 Tax=Oricola indica TaxID=2872591 RepID=UPI003CCB8A5C
MNNIEKYPWPDEKKSAFCFTVDVDAHSAWMWSHRQKVPELLAHLEQRNFGPRVGVLRLAGLLQRHGIKGSFFVPAVVAEHHPWLLPHLVEAGHEVGLHGYFHELVTEVSDAEFTGVLEASISLFEQQIGRVPKGFRSPAWEMTPHMLRECKRFGLYDSSLMGQETPYSVDGVTELPVSWATDDAIFFKFYGGAGNDLWPPVGTDVVYSAWKEELAASREYGTLYMSTVHDFISGRASRAYMLDRFLGDIVASDDVWIATAGEIARHHEQTALDRDAVNSDRPGSLFDHHAWGQS